MTGPNPIKTGLFFSDCDVTGSSVNLLRYGTRAVVELVKVLLERKAL